MHLFLNSTPSCSAPAISGDWSHANRVTSSAQTTPLIFSRKRQQSAVFIMHIWCEPEVCRWQLKQTNEVTQCEWRQQKTTVVAVCEVQASCLDAITSTSPSAVNMNGGCKTTQNEACAIYVLNPTLRRVLPIDSLLQYITQSATASACENAVLNCSGVKERDQRTSTHFSFKQISKQIPLSHELTPSTYTALCWYGHGSF